MGDATWQGGAQRVHGQRGDQRLSKGAEVAGGLGDLGVQVGRIWGWEYFFGGNDDEHVFPQQQNALGSSAIVKVSEQTGAAPKPIPPRFPGSK